MKVKYKPHSVKVLTDESWGSTLKSNLETIAWAAHACHEKGTVFKDPKKLIEKWAFKAGHYALLEFSNIEVKIGNPKDNKVINFRDWKKIINKLCEKESIDGIYTGSFRDIIEIFNISFEQIMNIKEMKFWDLNTEFINLPRNHPQKRIVLWVETNQDNAHKFRTERSISQLSLTGTAAASQEPTVVSYDPNYLKNLIGEKIEENYFNHKNILECTENYHKNIDKMSNKKAKVYAKYTAKHFMNTFTRNVRVMCGSVKQLEDMCWKRKKSPTKKKDVHALSDKILEVLDKWKNNKDMENVMKSNLVKC